MVLHITNDFSGSSVYKNLLIGLDRIEVPQIVYHPLREKKQVGTNSIKFKREDSKIIYRPILNYHIDRYFYPWKIIKILKDIQKQVDFSQIHFIHAHTWYSDGGVAYQLSKKYKIPYIVTIRNTDINVFQKRLKYLHSHGERVLDNADKVVLISAAYKERVLSQSSIIDILPQLKQKLEIIPNGVDPFWIKEVQEKALNRKEKYKLLYIGKFNPGKNILKLMIAIKRINQEGIPCTLELVGGSGNDEEEVLKKVGQYPEIFTYHGKVFDKEKLKDIFQSCDIFTMPSRNETFGLVYVEAMLQGLPILYTQGEGIDGFYEKSIGEKVSKYANEFEIKQAIIKMISNYKSYKIPVAKLIQNHDWSLIAKKYKQLYQN